MFRRILLQQIRHYPRWTHRQPKRVLDPEIEVENLQKASVPQAQDPQEIEYNEIVKKIKFVQPRDKKKEKEVKYNITVEKPLTISKAPKKKVVTDMLETIIDQDGNFIYTKMKDNDTRISTIMVEIKSNKEKEKKDIILLEGKRLIKDALESNVKLNYILFSRMKELEFIRPALPKSGAKLYKVPYKELQIWSDLTTNPGIMGIFKIPKVEDYQPKNSLPLTIICDNIREPSNLGAILRCCSGVGSAKLILTKGCVNLWESKVLRASAGAHFKLQIHRQKTWEDIETLIPEESSVFVADSSFENNSEDNPIPVLPYYSVNYTDSNNLVLIVGGETEGLSDECLDFVSKQSGVRVNIPLSNQMESLNTGTALGIIAFEIKRQLLTHNK